LPYPVITPVVHHYIHLIHLELPPADVFFTTEEADREQDLGLGREEFADASAKTPIPIK